MNELTKEDNKNLTLKERLEMRKLSRKTCLILDISASMNSYIEPGMSKISALRDIVSGIRGNPICIMFSTEARIGDKDHIPDPRGCTNMSPAFVLAKDQGFKEALMITDGEASDRERALKVVEGLKLQIMYVGAGPAPDFLNQLASKAGSFCTIEDLKKPKELTNKIQLLLDSGNKKGNIIL